MKADDAPVAADERDAESTPSKPEKRARKAAPSKKAPAKKKAAPVAKKADDESDAEPAAQTVAVVAKPAAAIGAATPLASLLVASDWQRVLAAHFASAAFKSLETFVDRAYASGTIFPPRELIFNALNTTPLANVKVVIVGQDPYFNPGQAMGLSFSVPRGEKVPPSLKRIYKVLEATVAGFKAPAHGDLSEWAQRGVLLLNATLTVESGKANSHEGAGWAAVTKLVLDAVAQQKSNVVFISWGGWAQKLTKAVDRSKHLVIEDPHPSPMSGSKFLVTKPFTEANDYLVRCKLTPVDWNLSK